MTSLERIKEISERCGMSEEIVRVVLKAETDTVVDTLLRGEKAVWLGRCIIKPRVKGDEIMLSCAASSTLKKLVQESNIDKNNLLQEIKYKNITKTQLEELL